MLVYGCAATLLEAYSKASYLKIPLGITSSYAELLFAPVFTEWAKSNKFGIHPLFDKEIISSTKVAKKAKLSLGITVSMLFAGADYENISTNR